MQESIFVTLIRRIKNKEEKFGRRQNRRRRRIKIVILTVLVLGGVGYLIYWLQTANPFYRTQEVAISESDDISPSVVLADGEELSTKDLLYLATKMDLDPNAPLPVQMEWVENRIEISKQLIAKSDDAVAQKEGILYRMEALQMLSNLNRKYKLDNNVVDTQLFEFCRANLSHGDPEVSKIAAVSIMMTTLHRFSSEPNAANRKDALEKCRQISSQLSGDQEIANAIFKFAKLISRSDLMVDDSVEFFKVVIDEYSASRSPEASGLAKASFDAILFGGDPTDSKKSILLKTGIKDRLRQKRRFADRELVNRILYSLNEKYLDTQGVDQLMQLMEIFVSIGDLDQANDMLSEVKFYFDEMVDSELADAARRKLAKFEKRLRMVGKPLVFNGICWIGDGNTNPNLPTLVIYWLPSDESSTRLLSSLNHLGMHQIANCVLVAERHHNDQDQVVAKLSKEMSEFHFTHLDDNSKGEQFIAQFSPPSMPFLVLLDREGKVAAINPDLRDLPKQVEMVLK